LSTLRGAGKSLIGASVRLDLMHYRLQAQGVGVAERSFAVAPVVPRFLIIVCPFTQGQVPTGVEAIITAQSVQ
jgi:hypothetical protein